MTTVRLDTRELDRIAAGLDMNTERVLMSYAFEVEKQAKINAPYDTTALRQSVYTEGKNESKYDEARAGVQEKRPGAETERHPTPTGKVVANVGPCVEYAEYVELGTSRMGAQPYLMPAVEKVSNSINSGDEFKRLFT